MPGNIPGVDSSRLINLRGSEDGSVGGDISAGGAGMANQVQAAFAKKYGLVKDAKVDDATQKKLDFLAKLPADALKKFAQENGLSLEGVVEEGISEEDDPDANLLTEVINDNKIVKKDAVYQTEEEKAKVEDTIKSLHESDEEAAKAKGKKTEKKVEAKGDEERVSILRDIINQITPTTPLDEAKKIVTDKVNSSKVFAGSKEKMLRTTAEQTDINELIEYLWNSLLKGEGLGVIGSEKVEESLSEEKEVSNMGRKEELDQLERIVTKAAALKTGQDANEPKEAVDKPKQKSVDMPKDDEQTEMSTSEADAKNAAAGGKKDLTAQQAETGDDKVEGADLKAGSQGDIDSKNKKARTTGDDIPGAGRQKTDKTEDGMVVKGQQAELGSEGEDTEKDLSVGKKDMGEVKLPKKDVKTTEVAAKPTQKSVDMPKAGDVQTDNTSSTDDKSKGLPGARSVKEPEGGEQQKVIYTAKFHRDAVRKTASYWDVFAGDKPLFKVSLKQVFGLGKEAVENWDTFKSPAYGKTVTALMADKGAKYVLDNHYNRGNWVTFYNVKTAQMTGESAGEESVPSVSKEVPQNMNITDEATEKIDNSGKAIDAPIVDILLNMLAPVLSADPEKFDADKIMKDLKDVFSDDKAIENFAGSLKEKASALKTEFDKDEEVGGIGGDVGEGDGSASLGTEAKTLTAAFKSTKDLVSYLSNIKSTEEGYKKLKEMFNKVASEKKSVTASLNEVTAKEASRVKAKKAIFTARLMVKKGMLKREEYGAKTLELARMDITALDQFKQSIASIPDPKPSKAFGRVASSLPLSDDSSGLPASLGKEGSVEEVKKIWSTVPKVDEEHREFAKKEKK
jgi:hypothetical protein